jgi:hypothetical protein
LDSSCVLVVIETCANCFNLKPSCKVIFFWDKNCCFLDKRIGNDLWKWIKSHVNLNIYIYIYIYFNILIFLILKNNNLGWKFSKNFISSNWILFYFLQWMDSSWTWKCMLCCTWWTRWVLVWYQHLNIPAYRPNIYLNSNKIHDINSAQTILSSVCDTTVDTRHNRPLDPSNTCSPCSTNC